MTLQIADLRTYLSGLLSKRLVRDGLWLAGGHGITVVTGLISIRLFTELAPPAVFGGANLLLGMLTLGMHTLIAPITQTQVRFHSNYADAGEGLAYTKLIARFLSIPAGFLIVLMAAVLIAWPALRLGAGAGIIGLIAFWIAVSTARGVLINRVQAERMQRRYGLWVACEAILTLLTTALCLHLWPSIEGYIAGQAGAITLALLAFGFRAAGVPARVPGSAYAPGNLSAASLRERAVTQIKTYGLPFASFAALGWITNLADRYILAANLDVSEVGKYVAAFGIASRLPAMFGALATDTFRPALFEAEGRGDTAKANAIFRTWITVAAVVVSALVAAMYVLGDTVARILLAPEYRPGAATIMCLVAAGYGFTAIAQILENKLLSGLRSGAVFTTKLSGALSNFGLGLLFVPAYGAEGAAMANLGCQAVQAAACLLYVYLMNIRLARGTVEKADPRGLR